MKNKIMKNKIKVLIVLIIGFTSLKSFSQSNALNFDGVNDYINLNTLAPIMANSSNFSIEFWMKADLNNQTSSIRTSLFAINSQTSSSNGLLIILGGANSQEGKLMIYDEGTSGTNADFTSTTIIGNNECHHIAYTRNGNTGTIYIDGNIAGSHSTNFTLSTSDLYSLGQEWDGLTGTPSTSQFYNGDMDEIRIWNTARTSSEIQANMNTELTGNEPGLIAYYDCNQGVANGNNTNQIGLTNSSQISGLNGTFNNLSLNGTTSNFLMNACISTQSNVLNFDGINDYVNLNILAPTMANSSNFSIEFWMKADLNNQTSSIRTSLFAINPQTNSSNGLLIILGGANSQEGKLMIYDEGTSGTNADFTSTTIIGNNECHHIAYTRNGNTGTIYIDGNIAGSHSTNFTLSTSDLYSLGQEWDGLTGTPSTSQFYNGDMDEIRIWNTARTSSEIQANMNTELTGNEFGLVAYYDCNQGVANGNNTLETNLTNTSQISGLNGAFNNLSLNGTTSNFVTKNCSPCDTILTQISKVVCEEYIWNQITYTQTGVYTNILTSENGCDSIVTLNLTVDHSTSTIQTVTTTGSYTWIDGITYISSNNTAIYTYMNFKNGCKHIIKLNLTIKNENILNFDGKDDYINLKPIAPLLANAEKFTVEFWMKADLNNQTSSIRTSLFAINPQTNSSNGLLIILGGANSQEGKLMIYDEGTSGTNADFTSTTIIGNNECHHIAYTRNGNTGTIYIDGNIAGSHSTNFTLSTSDLYSLGQEWDGLTGTPSTSQFYNGDMDEIRIWNTARTSSEIQANMNTELTGNEPGLIAYYDCNQGVANGNNTNQIGLTNSSPIAGIDGQFNNFTLNGPISNFILKNCKPDKKNINKRPYTSSTINNLIIYPNPSSNEITFNLTTSSTNHVKLFDINGKSIDLNSINNQNNSVTLNIQDLDNGMYFIHVTDSNGVLRRAKFTKIE